MKKKIIIISLIVIILIIFVLIFNSKKFVEKRTINKNLKELNYIKEDINKNIDFINNNLHISGNATTEYERFVIHGAADKFINDYKYNIYYDSTKEKLYLNFEDKDSELEINDNFELEDFKELFEILSTNYNLEDIKYETKFTKEIFKKATIEYDIDNFKIIYKDDKYHINNGDYSLMILNINEEEYQINITYQDKEYILTKTIMENDSTKYSLVHDKINITIIIDEQVTINVLSNLVIKLDYKINKIEQVKELKKTKNLEKLYKQVPAYRFYLLNLKGKI